MRLHFLYVILNIQLEHIYASPQSLYPWMQVNKYPKNGYECGDVFFHDSVIKKIVSHARNFINKGTYFPLKLKSEIFREQNSKVYFLWPIPKDGSDAFLDNKSTKYHFGVVFFRDSREPARVVAKTTANQLAKCIRWINDNIEPTFSMGESPNGYLCGRKFFRNDLINQSILQAKESGDHGPYPILYIGTLYWENMGYLIWPILAGKKLYYNGAGDIRPYYLVLDGEKHLVDVLVKGIHENLIRCIPLVMPEEEAIPDQYSELGLPLPTYKYLCEKFFFNIKDVERLAGAVKSQTVIITSGDFPKPYKGSPYNEPCLMWPIMKDGNLYTKGNPGSYRLILTLDFKVLDVAISSNDDLYPCDKSPIKAEKIHDTSDFQCFERFFRHQKLLTAAERACSFLGTLGGTRYPARYSGSDFTITGPYFTYPVLQYGVFSKGVLTQILAAGKHRVVITANCEVAGALTVLTNKIAGTIEGNLKRFIKCHRVEDGVLPDDYFSNNANIATEN